MASAFELLARVELATPSLPRKCSTTELQQLDFGTAKIQLFFETATKKIKKILRQHCTYKSGDDSALKC